MTDLLIYGAGGHGREIAWLANAVFAERGGVAPRLAFIDDAVQVGLSDERDGLHVWALADAVTRMPQAAIIPGVGAPAARMAIVERLADVKRSPPILVHPSVQRSSRVQMGEGTVVAAGVILTVDVVLGRYVHVNIACSLSHDTRVGDFTTIAPGARICGNVEVGRGVWIGAGATIINGSPERKLVIGDGSVVAAGACVVATVPAGITVAGVPARRHEASTRTKNA
jgi:sugar O-acyltransferase (sialic acid O-acetyltransferase NeuD family)